METKGYGNIPDTLFEAITFLAQALPKRSVPPWLELLFGAMLTQAGFVTEAWLAIKPKRHWTSYYKWLQNGKWSWVALGLQTARFALRQGTAGRVRLGLARIFRDFDIRGLWTPKSGKLGPQNNIHRIGRPPNELNSAEFR